MHSLKRPRDTHLDSHPADDVHDNDYLQPKRPALRSPASSVVASSSRILPLPRTHIVRAMQNVQDSPQASGTSKTSKCAISGRLADAEKEIMRLKAAVEKANAVISDRKRELRKTQGIISDLDTSLTCEICTYRMARPVALACGHAYCSDCIKQWFQCALSAHLAVHGYSPNDLVSPPMRSAIRDMSLPSPTRQRIFADVDILMAQCPQPKYTCPKCRRRVYRKPTLIFALQHLSATMAISNGQTNHETRALEATFWDDFFPIDVRELADI